jgi:hypothetical protein
MVVVEIAGYGEIDTLSVSGGGSGGEECEREECGFVHGSHIGISILKHSGDGGGDHRGTSKVCHREWGSQVRIAVSLFIRGNGRVMQGFS